MMIANQSFKETPAPGTASLLEHVRSNAERKGLAVNEKKTALMCVSAAKTFKARVKLSFNGQSVSGSDSLKILGVLLDNDCTFASHVQELGRRLRSKTWALSKLRAKGMDLDDLIEAYKSTIRPTAEYACPAWHSLLTVGQSEHLERQQTQALKNIFGVGLSAKKMRVKSGLERLWIRREQACVNFSQKNIENPRCAGWFERRPAPLYSRRPGATYRTFKEPTSRTDRHRNSPINYARRLLNQQ